MSTPTFCGECGAALEPGVTFCGECGSPVAAATAQRTSPPASTGPQPGAQRPMTAREARAALNNPVDAPRARPPEPRTPQMPPAAVPSHTAAPLPTAQPAAQRAPTVPPPVVPTTPVARFCQGCGNTLTPGAQFCRKCGRNVTTGARVAGVTAPPPNPAAPPVHEAPAIPAGPSAGTKVLKGVLRVVVPIASIVVSYYLTNKFLGPMLVQQLGDSGRQIAPAIVSLAVGGVARQLTK